jgi:hypothetical protein
MSKTWGVFLPMVVFLGACSTLPTGPNVMVLPGVGKPFDQFQVDDMVCRRLPRGSSARPWAGEHAEHRAGSAIGA